MFCWLEVLVGICNSVDCVVVIVCIWWLNLFRFVCLDWWCLVWLLFWICFCLFRFVIVGFICCFVWFSSVVTWIYVCWFELFCTVCMLFVIVYLFAFEVAFGLLCSGLCFSTGVVVVLWLRYFVGGLYCFWFVGLLRLLWGFECVMVVWI